MDFKGENKMSLYKDWADMVVEYVKVKGEDAFWEEYGAVQKVYMAACFAVMCIS